MHDIGFIRSLWQSAEAYYKLGFNITGIMNRKKAPYHKWEQLRRERQTIWEAVDHQWFKLSGIGVVTGINALFCLDFDKCDLKNVPYFLGELGLPIDYNWVVISGSGKGFHIWFSCQQIQERINSFASSVIIYEPKIHGQFGQLELRINCHVVMPPSKSVNGNQYRFLFPNDLSKRPIEINYENDQRIS